MDRSAAIAKIQAMLRLQAGTDFDGEASAAAAAIDRLCRQYGITVEDASKPQIEDSVFCQFGRINQAHFCILSAVASFYDAMAYLSSKSFKVIGSDAQQIVIKIYFDFIVECMESEVEKAYEAEKLLADLMGQMQPNRTFKHQFRLAFAQQVSERLRTMKQEENRVHEHKEFAHAIIKSKRFGTKRMSAPMGAGAIAGQSAGQFVSLNRQATGRQSLQLTGS